MPWPTCWCSWRLPEEAAELAILRYRQLSGLPWARSDDFRPDIEAATTVWAFLTSAMFLKAALGADPPPADPAKRMPKRRALILHRLAAAAGYRPPGAPGTPGKPAALIAFASELRAALADRWGEVVLPEAPAFR